MTKKVKKVFVGMLSAMIVSVMALACVGCMWTDNAQDAAEPEPVQDSGVYDAEGNMLVSGEVYDMSRGLMFAMPTAESPTAAEGITLHATLEPDTVQDWPLEWSVECDCETCKTAIKLTPQGDNCVVNCIKNFSDPLKIKVVPKDVDVSAECKVDFQTHLASNYENYIEVLAIKDSVANWLADIKYLINPLSTKQGYSDFFAAGLHAVPFSENLYSFDKLRDIGVRPCIGFVPGTDWDEVYAKVYHARLKIAGNVLAYGYKSEFDLGTKHDTVPYIGSNMKVFDDSITPRYDSDSFPKEYDPNDFLLEDFAGDKHYTFVLFRTKAYISMEFLMFGLYNLWVSSGVGMSALPGTIYDNSVFNAYVRWLDREVSGRPWSESVFGTFLIDDGVPLHQFSFGLNKHGFEGGDSVLCEVPESISLDQTSLTY